MCMLWPFLLTFYELFNAGYLINPDFTNAVCDAGRRIFTMFNNREIYMGEEVYLFVLPLGRSVVQMFDCCFSVSQHKNERI